MRMSVRVYVCSRNRACKYVCVRVFAPHSNIHPEPNPIIAFNPTSSGRSQVRGGGGKTVRGEGVKENRGAFAGVLCPAGWRGGRPWRRHVHVCVCVRVCVCVCVCVCV